MSRRWERYTRRQRSLLAVGAAMVAAGAAAMLFVYSGVWWWWLLVGIAFSILDLVFPCALVALVVYLVWAWRSGKFSRAATGDRGTLRASTVDRRIAGVCGGIAEYLHLDSIVVRIIALLLFITSPLLTSFLYLLLALALPRY
ncbi:PspC domain-containing protein [Curtanaerobium respiraculi]|uniref:PspC domain-containing protein n=1 Tax=Curtanaerobium respiraculi TaxID=2949669 RepID=UPI0024B34C88|nr:PspC domain-containing protein [Curtanaerobium respiraculi]